MKQANARLVSLGILHTQNKVNNDSSQQRNGQNRGTEAVIETALPPAPDALCSPVECHHGVDHRRHGDDGEEAG